MTTTLDTIDLGDIADFTATLTARRTGAPANVTTVTATATFRDDPLVPPIVFPMTPGDEPGVYEGSFKPTRAGVWLVSLVTTGQDEGVEWGAIRVRQPPI